MEHETNMPQQQSDSLRSHQRMQCMEVWGGNRQVERYLETPGLEAWIYSQPHEQASGGGDVYYVSSCASGRITRIFWLMSVAMACTHLSWQQQFPASDEFQVSQVCRDDIDACWVVYLWSRYSNWPEFDWNLRRCVDFPAVFLATSVL